MPIAMAYLKVLDGCLRHLVGLGAVKFFGVSDLGMWVLV